MAGNPQHTYLLRQLLQHPARFTAHEMELASRMLRGTQPRDNEGLILAQAADAILMLRHAPVLPSQTRLDKLAAAIVAHDTHLNKSEIDQAYDIIAALSPEMDDEMAVGITLSAIRASRVGIQHGR